MVRRILPSRLTALLIAVALVAMACGRADASTSNEASASPSLPEAQQRAESPGDYPTEPRSISPPPTFASSEPTAVATAEVELLLFVGDSISAQLHFAAKERSAVRGGPEVRWLLTAGTDPNAAWPDLLADFIDDPAATAIITTFGVWQAVAPTHSPADSPSRQSLLEEIEAFLAPMAAPGFARPSQALLLHSIDSPEADAELQKANSMIGDVAADLDIPVDLTLPGVDAKGRPTFVAIEGLDLPVRNEHGDETHYCAAATLVMADRLLDEIEVQTRPLTMSDVDALYFLSPESYFEREGC
jgi:hypothetical protein